MSLGDAIIRWDGQYPARPKGYHFLVRGRNRVRVDEQFLKSVLFLGGYSERAGFVPSGTGFMYSVETLGMRFDHVVTARHNIEGRGKIYLRVNKKEDGGAFLIETEESSWFLHPDTTRYTDVAVLRVGDVRTQEAIGRAMDLRVASDVFVLTDEIVERLKIAPGEPIVTIGMFTSHFGETHNIPVVRTGNICAMKSADDLVFTGNGYMEAYLVEVRSLGGLSGSPVYVQMAPSRIIDTKVHHAVNMAVKPVYLLGIMHGHFVLKEPNDMVFPGVRTKSDSADLTPDEYNAGVGVVVPFSKALDIINQPAFIAERERVARERMKSSGVRPDSVLVPEESAPSTTDENPRHKEDFSRLVTAATKKPQRDD